MESHASLYELVILNLYLGAIVYLIGAILQFVIIYHNKKISHRFSKGVALLLTTLILSVIFSIISWKFWKFETDIMFGPILIPSFLSEIIFVPVVAKILGYNIFKRRN